MKVTVTGFFNETFEGSEKQVYAYLRELKKRQLLLLNEQDLKYYKQIDSYNGGYRLDQFRERNSRLGLKITISK